MNSKTAEVPPQQARRTRGKPGAIDQHVAARIRLRRTSLGMSQEKLAGAIGVTFQQVQKYERGQNRIGAERLYHLSRVLQVPIIYFFEGVDDATPGTTPNDKSIDTLKELDLRRENLTIIRTYRKIRSERARRCAAELLRVLAEGDGDSDRGFTTT